MIFGIKSCSLALMFVSAHLMGSLTVDQIIFKKYGVRGSFNPSPVVQLIDQRGSMSWLHVVWAYVAKNYFAGLVQGQRKIINRSIIGDSGWWKTNNDWVQDVDVGFGMMRLLLDTDVPLAKAFFESEERMRLFTMRKRLYSAINGHGPIKDISFFKYAEEFYKFLLPMSEKRRLDLLSGVYNCPELYWQVLKSVPKAFNLSFESVQEMIDQLQSFKISIVSFLNYWAKITPSVWYEFLAGKRKELLFRVCVDLDHWILYVLTIDGSGSVQGTWYESRTKERHPICGAFESIVHAVLEKVEQAEDCWTILSKRIKNGQFCVFGISDLDLTEDRKSGKLMFKICFDYSTEKLTDDHDFFDGHAAAYLSPEEFYEVLKKCSFRFSRKTRPGFPGIDFAIGRFVEITPGRGHTYPVTVKIQTDKEIVEKYNKKFDGKKGANGDLFKPITSKQSFYFPKVNEFLMHILSMQFFIDPIQAFEQ